MSERPREDAPGGARGCHDDGGAPVRMASAGERQAVTRGPADRPQLVLAGNPNVGKTTLFNALTGLSAKVSNYPGITVERRAGTLSLPGGRSADLHDLPGTYSLNARSAEEQIAFDAIAGLHGAPPPDAVIVCIDATQVARSAYLLLQCEELGARCVVALTMVDEARAATPEPAALGALLGCEVVAVTARTRAGLPELVAAVERALRGERRAPWRWQPSEALRARIAEVRAALPEPWTTAARYGHALPAGDDALALWALTCIEPRTGDADDDELDVPPALREAVISGSGGQADAPSPGVGQADAPGGGGRAAASSPGGGRADAPGGGGRADASSPGGGRADAPGGGGRAASSSPGGGQADALGPGGDRAAAPSPGGGRADALGPGGDQLDLDQPVLDRWAFLDREIPKLVRQRVDRSRTERVDRLLLHRLAGFAVFLAVMAVMFMSLFAWSEPAIDGVDRAFKALGGLVRDALGAGIFTDFLVDGVIGGVGAVMVFLPQILLLFLFLGFLEDCGYLARVAYLMDRIMRSMNLHGRAFVPMLSGFACAVPAIMATRTMERRRDRILTMMVVPLMTCSARLPVYTLVIGALIPGSRVTQGLLMVAMYLFSVVTALAAAWVMSRTIKPLKAKRLPFLIELPPYRWPRWRDVLRMMWSKSSMFLREAGTVILACSIALWALLSFPRELPDGSPDYAAQIARADSAQARQALADEQQASQLANSYGGRLGHAIEPAIEPLGFDWKIGIGIVGAFAAREVFVSTLGIVYSVGGEADETSEPLRAALRDAKRPDGGRAYTPLVGLSLMIFFALACQCMSTLAVVRRETRSWRWPVFLFGYMTALAWLVSLVVYQGGRLLGFG